MAVPLPNFMTSENNHSITKPMQFGGTRWMAKLDELSERPNSVKLGETP